MGISVGAQRFLTFSSDSVRNKRGDRFDLVIPPNFHFFSVLDLARRVTKIHCHFETNDTCGQWGCQNM